MPILASLFADALPFALRSVALLAQANAGPKAYTLPWAIILPCLVLGLMVALRPAKRTWEVKKPQE